MRNLDLSFCTDEIHLSEGDKVGLETLGYGNFFELLLVYSLRKKFSNGVPVPKGKILARIQRKLTKLGTSGTVLTLEEAEFDLIKDAFCSEESSFDPAQYRLVSLYIDRIEDSKKEG